MGAELAQLIWRCCLWELSVRRNRLRAISMGMCQNGCRANVIYLINIASCLVGFEGESSLKGWQSGFRGVQIISYKAISCELLTKFNAI